MSVKLTIDGNAIEAREGETLLDLARERDIFIPHLCNFKGLSPVGACRLCLVEVKGVPRLLPACTTRVSEGMDVATDTERLRTYQRMILELMFTERNHVCSVCVANGNCELQTLAARLGVDHMRYAYRYPKFEIDATHERFGLDPNRCILCTRCVRVCEEVEGARTWNVKGRGIHSEVVTDLDEPWGESPTCTSCSKCVHVCPTGALFEKGRSVGEMRKRDNILPYLSTMRSSGR